MAFVQDSFTDTSGTVLSSHTGEAGATWTKHPGSGTPTFVVSNANRCRQPAAGTALYYASGVPASADYSVQALLYTVSTAVTTLGVCGRLDTTNQDFYHARWNGTTKVVQLYKFVGGAATQLGSDYAYTGLGTAEQSATIALRMVGDQISALIDGSVVIGPVTDTAITAVGRAGLRCNTSTADTTGVHFDDFLASDLGVTYTKTGAGVTGLVSTGTNAIISSETGSPAATRAATGADTENFAETAAAVAALSARGADAIAVTEAGKGTTAFVASGPKTVGNVGATYSKTGAGVSARLAAGADGVTSSETAASGVVLGAAGAKAYVPAVVHTKAGTAAVGFSVSGIKGMSREWRKAGVVSSTLTATGVDVVTYTEAGAAEGAWSAGSASNLQASRTGDAAFSLTASAATAVELHRAGAASSAKGAGGTVRIAPAFQGILVEGEDLTSGGVDGTAVAHSVDGASFVTGLSG